MQISLRENNESFKCTKKNRGNLRIFLFVGHVDRGLVFLEKENRQALGSARIV